MSGKIAVIDYGVGNLKSVTKAFKYVGFSCMVTDDADQILRADAVVLPGVGAFPDAAENLKRRGLFEVVGSIADRPLLGICLGMQLLFDKSEEIRLTQGLGLIKGRVAPIETKLKLPQIGWNRITVRNPSPLTQGLEGEPYVYFVHSFHCLADFSENITAVTDYGARVTAMVRSGSVYGCQFHPEKSGEPGLQILKNFGGLI